MTTRQISLALLIILALTGCALNRPPAASEAQTITDTPQPAVATRTFPPPVFLLSPTPTAAPSLAPATPVLIVTPTNTAPPTLTFTPTLTPTSIFYRRGYDTPIGDYYKFVIHKARDGEQLEWFAQKYNTTVEAILAINYRLTNPVWADILFVVPVNFSNVEGMPVFVVYEIKPEERGISVETLAKKLRVDLFDLKYYNGMMEPGQRPLVGDLILVPWWPDPDRKIIFDEPGRFDTQPEEKKPGTP